MQPKFTRRSLVYFCTRIIALALIFSASTQISSAQKKFENGDQQRPGYENTLNTFQKQQLQKARQAAVINAAPQAKTDRPGRASENDAGIPARVSEQINRPLGVCTTFTGNLAAGDPTLPGGRMFRDGVGSVCGTPRACPGTSGGAGNWYDTYTFVNPSASAQCITVDFTNTSANTFAHFASVHLGSFVPANVCTNYLGDQGSSVANGATASFTFDIPGGATVVFAVTSVTVGTGGTYSMVINAPVGCGAAPPCSWSASTIYPINVLDQANVTIGTDLYSFAGVSANAVIANSYRYNGTTWTAIAPTPQPLEYPAAVTDGTNAYILGGASSTGVSLTTLYRYNVATNTYTTLAPFTTGAWNPTAVYIAGKIYKFCGTGAAGSVNNLEIYDIASNTWTAGAPYPLAISFVSAIARGGFIYAGGGVQTVGTLASLKTYRYDPAANSWNDAAIADLPASRWGAAGDWYNNNFVMAGGYLGGAVTITNTATGWDQGTNTWAALPNMIGDRARMGGATYGPAFHVIGGRSTAAAGFVGTNTNQRLFCIPPTPCTGTPAPGNTIASTNPVCSGTNFTLSLQNNPFVSGFTYQWQSAPASAGPWTNLTGGTSITYTGSQLGATWYRCIVTCTPSALSGTSTPVLVADGQGVFNTQPVNRSTQCSGSATFNYTATGNSLTYAWEFRTTPTGFWYNVVPGHPLLFGAVVTGETTNALTLTGVPSNLNGYQFRGTIVGPCTAIDFTNVVTLTVTPLIATVNVASPVTICTGTVTALSLTNASTSSTTNFSSGPISIQIPDMVGPPPSPAAVCNAGINHTIPVALPPGAQIFRIDVTVNITHTYASDLLIVLKNQTTNQVMNLFYHKSAAQTAGANFVNTVISSVGTVRFSAVPPPFTGTFRADWELSPGFYGDATGAGPTAYQPTTQSWNTLWGGVNQGSGNWTLAICDPQEWAGDIGTLTSWSMNITYGAPSQGIWSQTSPATPPNTMFTDPGATIPYIVGSLANTIYVKPLATAPFTGNSATYCVVYSTSSPACTSPPTCVTVNVTSPITGLGTMADRQVCVGGTTSFSVSPGGGPLTYVWSESRDNGLTWAVVNNGGVYSGATTNTLTLTGVTRTAPVDMNNFLYRCAVTAAPCGSQTTNNARLTVFGLPTVTITATDLALLPNQTSTITATSVPGPHATSPNWAWTRNGSSYPGSTNSVVSDIDRMGVFQATVTDVNGCRNSSNQLLIEAETGDKLWLYPNPTSGKFQVRLFYAGVTSEKRRIQVFNSIGQEVMSQDILLSNVSSPRYQRFDINLTNQPSGVYLVKVTDLFLKKGKSGFVIKQSQ